MSRYGISGNAPHYHLTVGVETALPQPSFFGEVREKRISLAALEEGEPLVSIGKSGPPLRDLQQVITALEPSGNVSLPIQLRLIEELDTLSPFSLTLLGQELAALCQALLEAHFTSPGTQERASLVLDAQGWHAYLWPDVAPLPEHIFSQAFFSNQPAPLEYVSGSTTDHSILFVVHENGLNLALPVFTLFPRRVALCGPVALAAEYGGLNAEQLRVVQQEVLWIPDALRPSINTLWYRAWASVTRRGW